MQRSFGCTFWFLVFLYIPLIFFAFEPRHTYLTWLGEETNNHITVNVHTDKVSSQLELRYMPIESPNLEKERKIKNILIGKAHSKTRKHKFLTTYQIERIFQKPSRFFNQRFLYCFNVSRLKAGQTYVFTVGNPKIGFSCLKKFKTPAENNQFYRFVEGGDLENPQKAQKLLKLAALYSPTAFLLGGDYPSLIFAKKNYPVWDTWLDIVEKELVTPDGCLIPLILAIGNHEITLQKTCQKKNPLKLFAPFYFKFFPQEKEAKQSFFIKKFSSNLVFFVLDSGHFHSAVDEQRAWLHENLKKYQNCKYKFALYHVPIYPSVRFLENSWAYKLLFYLAKLRGEEKKVLTLLSKESFLQKKYWLPLFDKYNLTAAFEHHDGALKRTKPLKHDKINLKGTVYFGDGALSPINQIFPIQAFFNRHFAKTSGYVQFFWLVDIFPNKIVYKAISDKGKVLDVFKQVSN